VTPLTKTVWICALILFCLLMAKKCVLGIFNKEGKTKEQIKEIENKEQEQKSKKTSFLQDSDYIEFMQNDGSCVVYTIG